MEQGDMKKTVFSGLFWKFGERITAQLISLIVSLMLARLLSPSDYGAVALVMVFITIANVFVSHGLGSALIQKENVDELDFSSVFYFNILISVILYLFIFFMAPYVAAFYNLPVMSAALRILGIRIIVAAINSVQHAYVSRHMLFKRFFWSTLFGTVLSGVVGVILAYKGFGIWALVTQYLTNTCTDTIVLWLTVKWRPIRKCSWNRTKILFSFGWKLLVSGLLDTGYKQLRSLIIGKKYTSEDLAYYNQGDKYPSLIVTNINASISSVLFPAMSKFQNEKEKLKQMVRRSIQISSYVLWPMLLGFAVVSKAVVSIVLTEKWLPCVPYIQVFCISYGFWPIHTANLQAISALGRSDIFLKLEIIKKIMGLIIILVSMQISPMVMAISLVVNDLLSTVINAAPNRKLLNYTYFEQIKDIFPSFVMATIMGVVIYPIAFIGLSNILTVVLQLIIGMVGYITLSVITKHPSFIYLFRLIRR